MDVMVQEIQVGEFKGESWRKRALIFDVMVREVLNLFAKKLYPDLKVFDYAYADAAEVLANVERENASGKKALVIHGVADSFVIDPFRWQLLLCDYRAYPPVKAIVTVEILYRYEMTSHLEEIPIPARFLCERDFKKACRTDSTHREDLIAGIGGLF